MIRRHGGQRAPRSAAARPGAGTGARRLRAGVARWLGDIRTYFPVRVVQVMQQDAIERLGLTQLLLEPELLDAVQPDVHLVGTLLALEPGDPRAGQADGADRGRAR